jgi:hypothetical protein
MVPKSLSGGALPADGGHQTAADNSPLPSKAARMAASADSDQQARRAGLIRPLPPPRRDGRLPECAVVSFRKCRRRFPRRRYRPLRRFPDRRRRALRRILLCRRRFPRRCYRPAASFPGPPPPCTTSP